MVECGAKSESGNNKEEEREGGRSEEERGTLAPYPIPSLFFLLAPLCAVPTVLTPKTGYVLP